MPQLLPDKVEYCSRCGAYEYWEVMKLSRKEKDDEGEILVYEVLCTHCGRPDEYRTRDPKSIPERAKIREELLNPEGRFDPKKNQFESDLVGFNANELKPRLVNE